VLSGKSQPCDLTSTNRGTPWGRRRSRTLCLFFATTSAGGDFSCYGGSTPTPRIDKLAGEGIRFNNYTVESQCTPTRSAILTGRQSVRSGTYTVPIPGQGPSGLSPWEYTIANLLSDAGYAVDAQAVEEAPWLAGLEAGHSGYGQPAAVP
jgi:hypothetical protein